RNAFPNDPHMGCMAARTRTLLLCISFLLLLQPPRSTLFPYTTLFRSTSATAAAAASACARRSQRSSTWWTTPPPWSSMASRKTRSEEHTSELQSPYDLVCRLLLEEKSSDDILWLAVHV